MKNFLDYFFNLFFLMGWGLFYFSQINIFKNGIIPGNLYIMGKPVDINIYLYTLLNVVFIIWYSFLFQKYFRIFFVEKSDLKQKKDVLGTSCLLGAFWIVILGISPLISSALGVAHVEVAFWH